MDDETGRRRPLSRRIADGAVTVAVVAVVVLSAGTPSATAAQGISILLTNDDGFEASGLVAMREALVRAGHRVTVIAPLEDLGASGTSHATDGTIDYYRQSDGVWAIDGTPADAVTLGLVHVLREDPPHLVVAGVNQGQTVGANVLGSGVVGAAVTAARAGVPAIAVSVELDFDEADLEPAFPSTTASYGPAAELVVDVVRQLVETGGQGLLPARWVLNVNYPAVGASPPAGVRFATISSRRGLRQLFSVAGASGPARVETVAADPTGAEGGSDLDLLTRGFATVSVLDGDWGLGPDAWEPLLERLVIER